MNARSGPKAAPEIAAKQSERGGYHQRPPDPAIADAQARVDAAAAFLSASLVGVTEVPIEIAAEHALRLLVRALQDFSRSTA